MSDSTAQSDAGFAPLTKTGANESHPDPQDVQQAIADSRSYLLSQQEVHGDHWASNVTMERRYDVANALYYALLLHHLDRNTESKYRALDWALGQRDDGGGWGNLNANYLGLLACRQIAGDYEDAIADIRAENQSRGYELTDADNFSKFLNSPIRVKLFYLAVSDRYDRDELFDEKTATRFIRFMKMTPAFDGDPDPTEPFVIPGGIDQMLATAVLLLQGEADRSTEAERMLTVSKDLLLGRRQVDGVWGTTHSTILATFALAQTDYDIDDPQIERALTYIADNRQTQNGRIVGYKLPVWDTAYAIQALHESGVSLDHDALQRAGNWLYRSRTAPVSELERYTVLDSHPLPFKEYYGDGWGYKPNVASDWDTTSVALEAMSLYRGTSVYEEAAARDDADFLLEVQDADGSWSSWATDFSPLNRLKKWLIVLKSGREVYDVLFTNHPSPDVTGHALQALGANGYTVETNGSVADAVDWLLDNRDGNGLWDGTWGRGYTYGTSRALLGMDAVGVDMDRSEVPRAAEALLERQRSDGSWGPAGGGPTYTAWALQALSVAGISPDRVAIQRGVQFLLETQHEDGSWPRAHVMQNWGTMYYSLSVFTQAAALKALVRYAEDAGIEYRPPEADADANSRSMSEANDEVR